MRYIFPLITIILLLSGCTVNSFTTKECISDEVLQANEPAFYLQTDIPSNAVLTESCKEGCCALYTHPDYEIYQETFAAKSIDEAFAHISGRSLSELSAIQLETFPQDEYRFTCTAMSEEGFVTCSGKVFYDGEYCYSIVIRCPLESAERYQEAFSDFFSVTQLEPV